MPRAQYVDTLTAPEGTLRALHDFYVEADSWVLPDDPPMPLENRLAEWRSYGTANRRIPRWIVWDGDLIVAASAVRLNLTKDNPDNCYGLVAVHPDHRGQGLAREILRPLLDAAQEDKRTRIVFDVKNGSPDESFAEKAGLKKVFLDRRSRLVMADVDRDLIRTWVERASERASEYELLLWVGSVPEDHLLAFCDLVHVMNTAPSEDYEEEDFTMTPERWRGEEEGIEGRAVTNYTYVAHHVSDGELAGYTNIFYQQLQPEFALQIDTGVVGTHRNKGLGRWLKGAMLEMLLEHHPEIERIDTENAGSNEPMLNINVEMGFKTILENGLWQGQISTVRERLGL
jgi:GNAT superfamily N-acetyltransferase